MPAYVQEKLTSETVHRISDELRATATAQLVEAVRQLIDQVARQDERGPSTDAMAMVPHAQLEQSWTKAARSPADGALA